MSQQIVAVTGGLGRSGRWIADRLADEEWRVVCVDQTHPGWEIDARENLDFRAADLADRGQALDLLADLDPDAVVHWAALPSPTRHAGGRVFETNVLAAYNVLVGAGRAGARVAWASSESAYGYAFAEEDRLPERLPIREADALRPEDPYGTSKVVGEEVAEMVTRRFGVPVASFGELPDDCNVSGDDSALSVRKADEVLDWEPEYSWREAAAESIEGPELVRE